MAIIKRDPNTVTPGSLSDVAKQTGQTLAEVFINCEAVVVVDTSGSMSMADTEARRTRYDEARLQLEKLQADIPGKIAVIAFSDYAEFCPSGIPQYLGSGTAMDKALQFIKLADGTGIRLILISDGEPNDREATLRLAREFVSKIDTIYIGVEGTPGARFLRELAECTGGIAATQKTQELGKLGATVRLLLEA